MLKLNLTAYHFESTHEQQLFCVNKVKVVCSFVRSCLLLPKVFLRRKKKITGIVLVLKQNKVCERNAENNNPRMRFSAKYVKKLKTSKEQEKAFLIPEKSFFSLKKRFKYEPTKIRTTKNVLDGNNFGSLKHYSN